MTTPLHTQPFISGEENTLPIAVKKIYRKIERMRRRSITEEIEKKIEAKKKRTNRNEKATNETQGEQDHHRRRV